MFADHLGSVLLFIASLVGTYLLNGFEVSAGFLKVIPPWIPWERNADSF